MRVKVWRRDLSLQGQLVVLSSFVMTRKGAQHAHGVQLPPSEAVHPLRSNVFRHCSDDGSPRAPFTAHLAFRHQHGFVHQLASKVAPMHCIRNRVVVMTSGHRNLLHRN